MSDVNELIKKYDRELHQDYWFHIEFSGREYMWGGCIKSGYGGEHFWTYNKDLELVLIKLVEDYNSYLR